MMTLPNGSTLENTCPDCGKVELDPEKRQRHISLGEGCRPKDYFTVTAQLDDIRGHVEQAVERFEESPDAYQGIDDWLEQIKLLLRPVVNFAYIEEED